MHTKLTGWKVSLLYLVLLLPFAGGDMQAAEPGKTPGMAGYTSTPSRFYFSLGGALSGQTFSSFHEESRASQYNSSLNRLFDGSSHSIQLSLSSSDLIQFPVYLEAGFRYHEMVRLSYRRVRQERKDLFRTYMTSESSIYNLGFGILEYDRIFEVTDLTDFSLYYPVAKRMQLGLHGGVSDRTMALRVTETHIRNLRIQPLTVISRGVQEQSRSLTGTAAGAGVEYLPFSWLTLAYRVRRYDYHGTTTERNRLISDEHVITFFERTLIYREALLRSRLYGFEHELEAVARWNEYVGVRAGYRGELMKLSHGPSLLWEWLASSRGVSPDPGRSLLLFDERSMQFYAMVDLSLPL